MRIPLGLLLAAAMVRSLYAREDTGSHTPLKNQEARDCPGTIVYVAGGGPDRDKPYLKQFRLDAAGKLSPLTPSGIALPFTPLNLACAPDGKFLYVSDNGQKITAYRIQGNGALTSLRPARRTSRSSAVMLATRSPGIYITDMAFRPDGKFLYVSVGGFGSEGFKHGQVVVFRRNASGSLTKVRNAGVEDLEAPVSLSFASRGNFAYLLQYGRWLNGYDGHLSSYRVLPDGSLRSIPAQDSVRRVGIAPDKTLVSADGRTLYVSSKGFLTSYHIMPDGQLQNDFRFTDDRIHEGAASPVMTRDGSTVVANGIDFETGMPLPVIVVVKINADGAISDPANYWLRYDNKLQREPITRDSSVSSGLSSTLYLSRDDKFVLKECIVPHSESSGVAVYFLDKAKGELSPVSMTAVPHDINRMLLIPDHYK